MGSVINGLGSDRLCSQEWHNMLLAVFVYIYILIITGVQHIYIYIFNFTEVQVSTSNHRFIATELFRMVQGPQVV